MHSSRRWRVRGGRMLGSLGNDIANLHRHGMETFVTIRVAFTVARKEQFYIDDCIVIRPVPSGPTYTPHSQRTALEETEE